jgi:hypothetical protein
MPGPNSQPYARDGGRAYDGKTTLARFGLHSGQGMAWERKPANETKRTAKIRARRTRLTRAGRTRRS